MSNSPTERPIAWQNEEEWIVPPRQTRSRKTLQLILAAALGLFQEKGYESTTIADISERSGISVGAIYNRFSGKEAILHATLERYWERRYRETDQAMDPELCKNLSAEDIIDRCVEIVFSAARQDRGFWRLIERQRIVNPLVCSLLVEWNAHFERSMTRLLEPHADRLAVEDIGKAVHYTHNILRASVMWANLPAFEREIQPLDIDSLEFEQTYRDMLLAYFGLARDKPPESTERETGDRKDKSR